MYSGSSATIAVAAIMRSTTVLRRLPARGDHRCRHPAVGTGGICVEGDRVELVLSPLQNVEPTSPLGGLEVDVLFGVGPHLMRSSGKLSQRDGTDRHFVGKLVRCNPAPQDHDVGVQQASPRRLTGHRHFRPGRRRHPGPPLDSIAHPSGGQDHSAYIPDHGNCPVTARTVQGMARVRSGQAPVWPLSSDRSVRREAPGSSVTSRDVRLPGTFRPCWLSAAVTVTLEAGGADTYTQRAIPGI